MLTDRSFRAEILIKREASDIYTTEIAFLCLVRHNHVHKVCERKEKKSYYINHIVEIFPTDFHRQLKRSQGREKNKRCSFTFLPVYTV